MPGPRLPALTGNRLLFEDGLPVAVSVAGDIRILKAATSGDAWQLRLALQGRAAPSGGETIKAAPDLMPIGEPPL